MSASVPSLPPFKGSHRPRKMPTDPEGIKKYYIEANKKSYQVRYAGLKAKKQADLRETLVNQLNELTPEQLGVLPRTILNRMKALNEALTEEFETASDLVEPDANVEDEIEPENEPTKISK